MIFRILGIFFFLLASNIYLYAQSEVETQTYGFLHFQFNVDTAFVQLGMRNPVIHKVADNDTMRIKNGFYHIYFSYPTNEDTYVTQNVLRDSLYSLEHNFDLSKSEIDLKSVNASIRYLIGGDMVVLTDYDTDIYKDGEFVGQEYGAFSLGKEKHEFTLRNELFYPVSFNATRAETVLFKEYRFYPESGFSFVDWIPGISQLKRQEYIKSGLILGSIVASTALFARYLTDYSSRMPEYKALRKAYLRTENEQQALIAGNRMEEAAGSLDKINVKRNLAILGLVGILTFDLVEKINARKKLGTRKAKNLELFIAPEFQDYISVGAKLKL